MAPNPDTTEPTNPPGARTDIGTMVIAVMAVLALVISFVGFAFGDDGGGSASVGATGETELVLTEFALTPDTVNVPVGGSLVVVNEGGQIHNVMVEGTDLTTPDLSGGESTEFDLSSLEEGEYTIICHIPGHEAAGMTGTLVVGGDGEAEMASGDHSTGSATADVDWAAMDQQMLDSVLEFPAETEGTGNQPLEPEILDDGTKRFELTAQIVEWEVEPGKFVEAWTYNGTVPGPWIKVDVGDNVQVQVTNELPGGTDVHWHGVRTPFEMDGVSPITQDLIRSGEDFLYEFTAERKAVGMYHAHHMGHTQVPNGLLGVIQIGDVDIPRGRTISGIPIPEDLEVAQEIPMVLNDAGTIGLSLNGKSFPATAPLVTNAGDWVVVHYLNEGMQVHPMHQHQFPQLIVAKDGIPLDNPYWADTVNVAPGERYSVLINTDDPGTWVWHCHILNHVEREEGMFGMVTAMVVE
ncbi:MAG: multicopper oxidase domain-containing protein [Acidimicrobiales bacterium]|nr:multicopper oxidase domain-containing protein [Acidimicrobiales bacterium]